MSTTEAPVVPFRAPDRQPPYAAEAEVAVLGGMLIDTDAVAKAVEVVDDSMFYREGHRRIFRVMARLFQRGEVVDPTTVAEELRRADELEHAGGLPYLAELLDAVPTAANIEYHARIVRERALTRRLIETSSQIIRDAYEPGERTVAQLLDEAEHRIFQVAQSHDRQGFVWLKKLLYEAMEGIERVQASGGGVTGVPTGFPDLDKKTGGFQKGDLIILAARPSMGKTSLALSFCLHAAIEKKIPIALYSLEMSSEQVVHRLIASEGMIDVSRLRHGGLHDEDYVRLNRAMGLLNTAPMWIDDSAGLNVLEMRAKARRLKAEHPDIGLMIIDYLQLMDAAGSSSAENRQQQVSEISRGLKALARELEVPVIALSQLSRAPEQRTDHRPQLSDLRESGAIEQDADLVMFLFREEYYHSDLEAQEKGLAGKAELIIGKQRNGPTGTVELFFRKESTRFESFTSADLA
ncbi:MAG: replicative DNA helicase [Gemmatimonadetes bacterium]|nr:replicative DNA helicase [Gemmatimonadota bacterium]